MAIKQFNLLKTQRFLPLFITQFLSAFNDNVFKNALIILITYEALNDTTINSALLINMIAALFVLPFFLFSATAGQVADKYEKSRLISTIKLVEIGIMALATIGFYKEQITLLMVTLFLLGTHSSFFGPLKYAILPDHLKTKELIAGNGLIEAGTFLAILLGTIMGGILIIYKLGEFIICSVLMMAAVIGWISSWYIPQAKTDNPNLKVRVNFLKETVNIMAYAKAHKEIFIVIIAISWFWLFGSVFITQMPIFSKVILHANEHVFTFFISIFSVGIALGSLLCNRLLKGNVHATYVPLGAIGMMLFTVDLFFASHNLIQNQSTPLLGVANLLSTVHGVRVTIDLFFIALAGGIYTVPLYAILQHRSEVAHRARVIASNNIMNALFMVIAALLTTLALSLGYNVLQVLLATSLLNILMALYTHQLTVMKHG